MGKVPLYTLKHKPSAGKDGERGRPERPSTTNLSDAMHISINFSESTLPQNRQLDIFISNSKQQVDDFVWELTL